MCGGFADLLSVCHCKWGEGASWLWRQERGIEFSLLAVATDLLPWLSGFWRIAPQRHPAPIDQAYIGDRLTRGANGRVVTMAVRAPVRRATRWMGVVSSASARRMAGGTVVSRRSSLDFPAPGRVSSEE